MNLQNFIQSLRQLSWGCGLLVMMGWSSGCLAHWNQLHSPHNPQPDSQLKAMVGNQYWLGVSELTDHDEVYYFSACLRDGEKVNSASCLNVFRNENNQAIYFKTQTMDELRQQLSSDNAQNIREIEVVLARIESQIEIDRQTAAQEFKTQLAAEIAQMPMEQIADKADADATESLLQRKHKLEKAKTHLNALTGFQGAGFMILSALGLSQLFKWQHGLRYFNVIIPIFVSTYAGLELAYFTVDKQINLVDQRIRDELVTEIVAEGSAFAASEQHQNFLANMAQKRASLAQHKSQLQQEFYQTTQSQPGRDYSLLVSRYSELMSAHSGHPTSDGMVLQMTRELGLYIRQNEGVGEVAKYCFPQGVAQELSAADSSAAAGVKQQVTCFGYSS